MAVRYYFLPVSPCYIAFDAYPRIRVLRAVAFLLCVFAFQAVSRTLGPIARTSTPSKRREESCRKTFDVPGCQHSSPAVVKPASIPSLALSQHWVLLSKTRARRRWLLATPWNNSQQPLWAWNVFNYLLRNTMMPPAPATSPVIPMLFTPKARNGMDATPELSPECSRSLQERIIHSPSALICP